MTTTQRTREAALRDGSELHLVLFVGQTREDDEFYDGLEAVREGTRTNLYIVDVWDDPASAIAFRVSGVPTLVAMHDGVETARLCGASDAATIRTTLEQAAYC